MRKFALISTVVLFVAGIASAQQSKPADKTYVLKAARMFDGKSDSLTAPGLIVVAGGKIVAVGSTAAAPSGAEVLDFGDATLLPGFIDAHTHLTGEASDDWKQDVLDSVQKSYAEQALDSTVYAKRTLMAGFTTVRDVGAPARIDVALRNAIREGIVVGPRMLVAAGAIGSTGGHCDDSDGFREGLFGHEYGPQEAVANGPDQMRYAVRLAHKYGADVIKTCASGGVLSLTDDVDTPQLTQEELNALIDEAHSLKRKVAAHCHGSEAAKRAIRAGVDWNTAPSSTTKPST
jgi:imidazolonepropionase-like amidohydrolase